MRNDMSWLVRRTLRTGFVLSILMVAGLPSAEAQYGSRALVGPGDAVPKDAVAAKGGTVGQVVAPLIGVRPVLVVYWRPGDGFSERALTSAESALKNAAPGAVLVPVAVVAAGQKAQRVQQRLGELGLSHLPAHRDAGQFAQMIGVRQVPAYVLIDVTGVLRLVGGADLQQKSGAGVSILDALILASRGQSVPTLGLMSARPIYQLLGRPMPPLTLTELDGKTWRKLTEYLQTDKKLLVFYWSPICPHCIEALPKLRRWYESSGAKDVVLVDIARADNRRLRAEVAPLVGKDPRVHLLDVN